MVLRLELACQIRLVSKMALWMEQVFDLLEMYSLVEFEVMLLSMVVESVALLLVLDRGL